MFLKQSTSQTIRFGPCLDKTDGVTEETALTLAQADMRLSKDGGAFAQKNAAGNATHDSDGWYSTTLNATDTNTVGELILNVHQPANMLPVWMRFYVVEEAIYDALFAASAAGFDTNGRVDVGSWNGTSLGTTNPLPNAAAGAAGGLPTDSTGKTSFNDVSAADVNTQCDTALSDIGLDHLIFSALPTNWATDVASGSVFDNIADDGTAAYDRTTDSLQAIRDRGDTSWITGGGGGLTQIINVVPLIPPVIDLANTATYRIGLKLINSLDDLPSTAEITPGTLSIDRKAQGGTSWTNVVNNGACSESAGMVYYDEVFDTGTGYAAGDMLRFTFKSQSITADANTHEITDATGAIYYSGILGASDGSGLTAIPWNSAWDTEVQSECNDAMVALGLDHLVSAAVIGTDITDNSIIARMVSSSATADWDTFVNTTDSLQAVRDHIGDGTNLTEAGGTGDHLTAINLPNQTMDITGNITGNLSGSVGSVTGAVGSVTGNVGGSVASVTGAVGSVTGNVGGNVTGSVGSNLELGPAEVNAEVVDALNTDTYAEPGQGAPGATISLAAKIGYLYKSWRNRSTQTATQYSLYNDDATTVDHKSTVSDNGTTADKGEVGTGP